MSKLDKLKNIIDDHFKDLKMTEADRAAIRRRIAEKATMPKARTHYGWYYATGALALACLLTVILVLPALPGLGATEDHSDTASMVGETETAFTEDTADTESMNSVSQDGMSFDVLAAARTSGVVTPDTSFFIDVYGGTISTEELEARISIEPAVSFTLVPETETRYCLTPNEPFENGEIVTLSIEESGQTNRWAFQTESALQVVSTLPGNDSSGMPLETGIEISFSRLITGGVENHLAISPETKGTFQYYGKTVAFIPEEDLLSDTVYTVSILPGLTADSGEILETGYTFSFRTPRDYSRAHQYFYLANEYTESFLPDDPIAVGVYASSEFANADVTLWQLDDAEQYLELAANFFAPSHQTLGNTPGSIVSTKPLSVMDRFQADLIRPENTYWYGGPAYILFPELQEGWYLAELTVEDETGLQMKLQKLLQVSPLSVYYQASGGKAMIWLNDSQTGRSVQDANVTLTMDTLTHAAMTNTDGIAELSYPSENSGYAKLQIQEESQVFAELIPIHTEADQEVPYHAYLYLDRAVYQSTDTVQYWGILLPKNGAALPNTLDVTVSSIGEPRIVDTVEVRADGTFQGTYSFENAISSHTTLGFSSDSITLCSTYYQVMEYTKPCYVLNAAFDQDYYRKDETMSVEIDATFYDGTPASGLDVFVSKDTDGYSLQLDMNGLGSTSVSSRIYHQDWTPTQQYVHVSSGGKEDVSVSAFAQALYFPSDYMLTAEPVGDGSLSVQILSNAINFHAVEAHLDNYSNHLDELRGESAEVSGTATLWGSYYEQIETGSYYDPINKVSVPVYDYVKHEDPLLTETFETKNGRYTTSPYHPQESDPYSNYYLEIRYLSPDGLSFETTVYLNAEIYPGNFYSGYYFTAKDNYRHISRLGETTEFLLQSTEPVTEGVTLLLPTTDHTLYYELTDPDAVSVTYTSDMIPNVTLYAAYFDGRHVYAVQEYWMRFDIAERELDISISTNQENYAPGDTVTGQIHITDASGKPKAAHYAIGVVDEAVFAILEQDVNPAEVLYQTQYYETPVRYTSYVDKNTTDVYAEGGGGDGYAEARSEFADTAAFLTGSTDAHGTANFSFPLPDNLTSWRITAAAVTNDRYAGSTKTNISVSQPFFLNLVLNDTYTVGDDISLSARVYGVKEGTAVSYSIYLDGKEVDKISGLAGDFAFANLGKLSAGCYELTVTAKAGDQQDGIRRTITVKESRHELTGLLYGSLSAPVEIDAVRYPVVLMLYDETQKLSMEVLSSLYAMGGSRLDQKLAASLAAERLTALYPESGLSAEPLNLAPYQHYSGGLKLFPYSDPDPLCTALALVTAAEHLDTTAAASYFYEVLHDRSAAAEQVAAAYLGLSVLREPVLSDLHVLLTQDTFTEEDRLILACALAVLGDQSGAKALYQELVLPYLVSTNTWHYLDRGDYEENYTATSSAALLAILLDAPEQNGMIRYLLDNQSAETLAAFPLLAYLTRQAMPVSDAAFSCQYNGEDRSWSLKDTPVVVLQFDREELDAAKFRATSGKIAYTALYTGGIDTITANAGDQITISDTGSADAPMVGSAFALSVSVSFSADCPGEYYTLDLVLPSGTRYAGYPRNYRAGYSLIAQEGNRLTFLLNRNTDDPGVTQLRTDFSIQVTARAVLPGEYVIETPIVRGTESALTAVGQSSSVVIS